MKIDKIIGTWDQLGQNSAASSLNINKLDKPSAQQKQSNNKKGAENLFYYCTSNQIFIFGQINLSNK